MPFLVVRLDSVGTILKRVVDGLVINKMNYMHIHFTDVASFPMASEAFPMLAAKGRMSRMVWKSADSDAVYSAAALKSLVAYAAERGVRVVPEVSVSELRDSLRNAMAFLSLSCQLGVWRYC
eukprot:SAG22_NODE_1825_length_3505_cov_3.818849_3_plen_122_part_00